MIYRELLVHRGWLYFSTRVRHPIPASIIQVSKLIYSEATPVLYGENRFDFQIRDDGRGLILYPQAALRGAIACRNFEQIQVLRLDLVMSPFCGYRVEVLQGQGKHVFDEGFFHNEERDRDLFKSIRYVQIPNTERWKYELFLPSDVDFSALKARYDDWCWKTIKDCTRHNQVRTPLKDVVQLLAKCRALRSLTIFAFNDLLLSMKHLKKCLNTFKVPLGVTNVRCEVLPSFLRRNSHWREYMDYEEELSTIMMLPKVEQDQPENWPPLSEGRLQGLPGAVGSRMATK